MATWEELARDNRLAAYELKHSGRWRACVSRAYYAIYSATTGALVQQGVTMPKGRGNPRHEKLPRMIRVDLRRLTKPIRAQLASTVAKLWGLRLAADYKPQDPVDSAEGFIAIALMQKAFRCMERKK